jgi:uncharacterized membrane protein
MLNRLGRRLKRGLLSTGRGVKKTPKWVVLRLSTVSGVSAGWWAMALIASIIGAVSAVTVVTIVQSYLKRKQNQAAQVSLRDVSEPESGGKAKTVIVE